MNVRPHPTKQKTFVIKFWHKKRHYKKTTPAENMREAHKIAHIWRGQVASGQWAPKAEPQDLTMPEATSRFIEEFARAEKKSWKNDLVYQRRCDKFFAGRALGSITALDVQRFRSWLCTETFGGKHLNDLSANRHHQFAKAVLNKMRTWKLFSGTNPFSEVRLTDETRYQRNRCLTQPELQRLLEVSHESIRPILVFAVHTGLRPKDMRELTRAQVDLESRSIHLPNPKSGKREWVPLNETALATVEPLVRGLLSDSDLVFDFTNAQKRWRMARRDAGIEGCRFYDATRHTAGSWITMTTGSLAATQRILRHRDPKTTMRYSHWAEPQLRQAVLGLDSVLATTRAERPEGAKMPVLPTL